MTSGRRAVLVLTVLGPALLGAGPCALAAQAPGGSGPPHAPDTGPPDAPRSLWSRGWRPVALSAAVPGTGQLALDRRRGWLYLGAEAAAWIWYADRRGAADSYRAAYRDHAWERARTWDGARVDGDFDYYERLARWHTSGAYDGDPGATGLQPETDETTYNGSIWARARGLFMPPGARGEPGEPGYEEAVAYYRRRAYSEELLWDWSGDPGAQEAYRGLIDATDVRARQATAALGVILANHLLSAIDAFLTERGLSGRAGVGPAPAGLRGAHPSAEGPAPGGRAGAAAGVLARTLLALGGGPGRPELGHVPPAGVWHLIVSWRIP